MLLLVPLWWLSLGSNVDLPVHLALTLGAIFDVFTMLGLWQLTWKLTRSRAMSGLIAVAYAVNPYALAASVNGLETSLANALLLWSLVVYGEMRGQTQRFHLKGGVILVLLWSLLGLARADYLILVLPCALEWAWRNRRYLVPYGAIFVGMGLLWLPWLTWNYLTFGSVLQVSGLAYPYYRHIAWEAHAHTFMELLAHQGAIAYHFVGLVAQVSGFGKVGLVLLACAAAGIAGVIFQSRRKMPGAQNDAESERLMALVLPSLGYLSLLSIHAFVRWNYALWYFAPSSLFALSWFGAILDKLTRAHRGWIGLAVGVYLLVQIWQSVYLWSQGGVWPEQRQFADNGMPGMIKLCEQFETIGVSDSGYMGYYLPCRVINLDGVVNNPAFRAIQEGTFLDYLDASGIQYVVINDIVRSAVAVKEGYIPTTPPFRTKN
jgi:hypothetical protein